VARSPASHASGGAAQKPNRVGRSWSTSTPRWPSRHRRASGERLRPQGSAALTRRRATDGDLRRPSRRLSQGRARDGPRRPRPPSQRRPSRRHHPSHAPGAHPLPHLLRRHRHQAPQRQRQGDRCLAVVPTRRHPTGHHEEDRLASGAAVPPAADHRRRRFAVGRERATNLAVANPVAVQPEWSPDRTARALTSRASPRSGLCHRRQPCEPPLDVERGMDDP
jgi:hypothetical protein